MATANAAVLKAVLDAPDDDAPRLAYAAWAEGRGDAARAELIRSQIELSRMKPADKFEPRAFALEARVRDLIGRHGTAWAGPLAQWVDAFHFLRGFAGLVRLSAKRFLENGERLLAEAPVQHFDLTGVRDVDEALFDSPLLAGVRSLSMDGCGLHDLHLQMLAASPHARNLRWLSLADNHLGLAAAEAMAASPYLRNLRYVELHGNPADPVEELGYDSGIVVASSMPPEGQALEARFGPQAWLHRGGVRGRFAP